MFESEFCQVDYRQKENVVFIKWKKFCCGEDYRKPLLYALKQLEDNKHSNVVADARDGFEDEKEDVVWAFHEFIPGMAKTDCKQIIFIMNQDHGIDGEIDMFTREFMKYFEVKKVFSYEEAIAALNKNYL